MSSTEPAANGERADLLETLTQHRHFLRYTVRDLTNDQAAQRTTVSELCLGGLIKHVTAMEREWINFIVDGPKAHRPASGWDSCLDQRSPTASGSLRCRCARRRCGGSAPPSPPARSPPSTAARSLLALASQDL
ncbi:MAG: DUF664 domain-containing protein [Pseudonocardiaceae bacterium]